MQSVVACSRPWLSRRAINVLNSIHLQVHWPHQYEAGHSDLLHQHCQLFIASRLSPSRSHDLRTLSCHESSSFVVRYLSPPGWWIIFGGCLVSLFPVSTFSLQPSDPQPNPSFRQHQVDDHPAQIQRQLPTPIQPVHTSSSTSS